MANVKDDPGNYFQTSDSLATNERKAAKAKNQHGNPIKLSSKILAVIADPRDERIVYVAEAAGEVKRVDLEVCKKDPNLRLIYSTLTIDWLDERGETNFQPSYCTGYMSCYP
jgi:hypothetical protein